MKLTKENIKEWKALLTSEMLSQYGLKDFAETLNDEDWLRDYEGQTVQEVIDEEMLWSAQN